MPTADPGKQPETVDREYDEDGDESDPKIPHGRRDGRREMAMAVLEAEQGLEGDDGKGDPELGTELQAAGIGKVLVELPDRDNAHEPVQDDAGDVEPVRGRDPEQMLQVECIELAGQELDRPR